MIEAHKTRSWTAYNAAQVEEKVRFTELLADLCSGVEQPEQTKGTATPPCGYGFCRYIQGLRGFLGKTFYL